MGYMVRKPDDHPEPEPRRGPPIEGEELAVLCVPFCPWRCPRCGSAKPRTYGQRGRVRFHKCCGLYFRSIELTPDQLRDLDPDALKETF